MDPISGHFFQMPALNRSKILEAKYWVYWTVFNKCFASGPYLMDPIFFDSFSEVRFKYLEVKY